ncbi:hypothetical protein [Adlercreutzia murintestinalis]|uniref:hypothetical protein n=1 Tax=Adlercreutzia murintestinalis TaxID=2941325 RepID=UPI00203BC00D|nr:hypothetical protein [Adlercreutzia murintestinalis]
MAVTQIGESYIANVKFKKRKLGGVDEIDAINHLDTLSKTYEQEILRRDRYYQEQLANKDQQMQQAYSELASLQEQIQHMQMGQGSFGGSAGGCEQLLQYLVGIVERIEQRMGSRSYMYPN